jgi:hypothetical protein
MPQDIDDNNPAITYGGAWGTYTSTSTYGGSMYGGSGRSSHHVSDTVTLSFTGTRIQAYFTMPKDEGTVYTIQATFNLDGSTTKVVTHDTHPYDINHDNWFDSWDIPNGQHTLTITNTSPNGAWPIVFDSFSIEGTPVTPRPPRPPSQPNQPNQPTQNRPTTTSQNPLGATAPHTTTGTSDANPSNTALAASNESTTMLTSSMSGVRERTVTIQQTSTGADGSVTTQTAVIVNTAATSTPDFPLGAIIGIVMCSVLILLLLIFLVLFLRRRRKNRRLKIPEHGDEIERRNTRTRRTDVTPFPLAGRASSPESQSSEYHGIHPSGVPEKTGLHDVDERSEHSMALSSTAPLFSNSTSENSENDGTTASFSTPPHASGARTASPTLLPSIDTGPSFRPRYLSGDAMYATRSPSGPAVPSTNISLVPTTDFPPPAYDTLRHSNIPPRAGFS